MNFPILFIVTPATVASINPPGICPIIGIVFNALPKKYPAVDKVDTIIPDLADSFIISFFSDVVLFIP